MRKNPKSSRKKSSETTRGPAGVGKLKQVERKLLEAEERYKIFIEEVSDYGMYIMDLNGKIMTWNVGAQRLKGYTAKEVIGRPFSLFYTAKDRRDHLPETALRIARKSGRFAAEGW